MWTAVLLILVSVIEQCFCQGQSEPIKFLKVNERFNSFVTRFSDKIPAPRNLIHGGWMKAINCQGQFVTGRLDLTYGPEKINVQEIDGNSALFMYTPYMSLPCGVWAHVVYSFQLTWSNDDNYFLGKVEKIFLSPAFTGNPNTINTTMRILKYSISSSDPKVIYYQFDRNISMRNLFYYADQSTDPIQKATQIMLGPLVVPEILDLRLNKYFRIDFFVDSNQKKDQQLLDLIGEEGIDLEPLKEYKISGFLSSERLWPNSPFPDENCTDIKIHFSVDKMTTKSSSVIVIKISRSNGNLILNLTVVYEGGGDSIGSIDKVNVSIWKGAISSDASKSLIFPSEGVIERFVIQLKSCLFQGNLYIRHILHINEKHQTKGNPVILSNFNPLIGSLDLKLTSLSGSSAKIRIKKVRIDRGALDLSMVDRPQPGDCSFRTPVLSTDLSLTSSCLICKETTYNVEGVCSQQYAASIQANSSCKIHYSQSQCSQCTSISGLLFNKVRDSCTSTSEASCLASSLSYSNNTPPSSGQTCSPSFEEACSTFEIWNTTLRACQCRIQGCSACELSVCDSCSAGLKMVQLTSSLQCVSSHDDSVGLDLGLVGKQVLKTCHMIGCKNCSGDYTKCYLCDPNVPECELVYDCHPTCLTCSSFLSTNCITCDRTVPQSAFFYPDNSTCGPCLEEESGRSQTSNGTCIICDASCRKCEELPHVCVDCITGNLLWPEVRECRIESECGLGYFGDSNITIGAYSPLACQRCHSKCKNCSLTNNNCTSCITSQLPKYNDPGNCGYTQCSSTAGYTLNLTDSSCTIPCNVSNCAVCTSSDQLCTVCSPGFFLKANVNSSYTCEGCTGNGRIGMTGLGNCLSCDQACVTCSYSPFNCSSCVNGVGLKNLGSSIWKRFTCENCNNIGIPGSFILDTNGECSPCQSACETCQTTTTNCLTCKAGYWLYPNKTCGLCTDLGFIKSGSDCIPCDPNCLTCEINTTFCTSCPQNKLLYLVNNSCGSCKEIGFTASQVEFASGPKMMCIQCSQNCLSCFGNKEFCLSCKQPPVSDLRYLFDNFTCTNCTEPGFILQNTACKACSKTCSSCSGNPQNCTNCTGSLALNYSDNTCVPCRTMGFYIGEVNENGIRPCVKCPQMCSTCISSTECISCRSGLYKYQNDSCGECLEKNLTRSFGMTCRPCHSRCLNCNGILETSCTSCRYDDYLTEQGRCEKLQELLIVSSEFISDFRQVVFKFNMNVQSAEGGTIEGDTEVMIFNGQDKEKVLSTVAATGIDTPLKDITVLTPFDSFQVEWIRLQSDSLKIRIKIQSVLKNACFLVRFRRKRAITAENQKQLVLEKDTMAVGNIEYILSNLEATLELT